MVSFTFAQCRRANLLVCHICNIFGSRRTFSFMAVSQLSVCMCLMWGLACIVLYCFHSGAAYVLCVFIMSKGLPAPWCVDCVCAVGERRPPCLGVRRARAARACVVCFTAQQQRRPRCSACPERSALARDTSSTSRPTGTFRRRMKRTGTRSCGGGLSQSSDAVQS